MNEGFIKIHRKLLEWEWYNDTNTKVLFIHLLLKANWKDARFRGIEIKRGQLFTSIDKLSESLGMTRKKILASLNKLKRTSEVDIKGFANGTTKGTLITLTQYSLYQDEGQQKGQQKDSKRNNKGDNKGTTKGQQRDTNEEEKEKQEEKESITHPLQILISQEYPNISKLKSQLTEKQAEALHVKFKPEEIKDILDAMENKVDLTKKYSSVNLTIQNWMKRKHETGGNKPSTETYKMPINHML